MTRATLFISLLFMVGPASTDSTVYRCKTGNLAIEFRSYPCDSGFGTKIELKTAPTGWIKPDKPDATTYKKPRSKPRPKKVKASVKVKAEDRACWKARQRLERIHWELRKGYRPVKGERLRQQRREQEAYLQEFCY